MKKILVKISDDQIKATYEIAKRVYIGDLEKEAGAKELNEQQKINFSSACDYIKNFRQLMDGLVFHRTMNAFATNYYFTNIKNDYGVEFLARAISAVQKHIEYYEGIRPAKLHELREVIDRHLPLLEKPINLDEYQKTFSRSVEKSLQEPAEIRKKRLEAASKLPKKITTTCEVFVRNPDVVAEVLHRANGACERCKQPAPFLRLKDKSPYLEVHHTIQLAHGGKDTTDNAIALCPNCHRELHFGVEPTRF
jgi:5-methylcytosine-specific restriction protein A